MNRDNTIALTVFMILLCVGISLKNSAPQRQFYLSVIVQEVASTHTIAPYDTLIHIDNNNHTAIYHCIVANHQTRYRTFVELLTTVLQVQKDEICDIRRHHHPNGTRYYYIITTSHNKMR